MRCQRCGKCCQNINNDIWKTGEARPRKETCGKLTFEKGLAVCTIQETKPLICSGGWGGIDVCPARLGEL